MFIDDEFIPKEKLQTKEDFLAYNPEMKIYKAKFAITAIVDTKINEDKFKVLKDDFEISHEKLLKEHNLYVKKGIPNCYFVKKGFENNYNENYIGEGVSLENGMTRLLFELDDSFFALGERIYDLETFEKQGTEYLFFDENKTTLEPNEVLLDYKSYFRFARCSDSRLSGYYKDIMVGTYKDIRAYALANYTEAYELGFDPDKEITLSPFGPQTFSKADSYVEYMANQDGFSRNKYGKNGKDFELEYVRKVLKSGYICEKLYDSTKDVKLTMKTTDRRSGYIPPEEISVVGINYQSQNYNDSIFIVHDEFYEKLSKDYDKKYNILIPSEKLTPETVGGILKLYSTDNEPKFNDEGIWERINLNNKSVDMYKTLESQMSDYNSFLKYAIIIGLVACLLLFNFIGASINNQKREIGILRAIGATKSDVVKIFSLEGLFICIMSIIIASTVSMYGVTYLQEANMAMYQFDVNIFHFGIVEIMITSVIGIVGAVIASFIPIMRIAKKKPIDAINNN